VLTYTWTQISGPPVELTPSPDGSGVWTFVAPPAQPGPQVLRFALTVNDGVADSEPDVINIVIPGTNTSSPAEILIVAPHPDDDIITSSGIIQRAAQRGEIVRVVFVTNGDAHGVAMGLQRQQESVDAQRVFGTPEDRLIFLGYPDSALQTIKNNFSSAGSWFTSVYGVFETYGTRGLGGTDYHSHRFGAPGLYNWPTMVSDLSDIINTTRPTHIFTTSEWDTHADHNTTYALVKAAVDATIASSPAYNPTLHVTTVWPAQIADEAPWPAVGGPSDYFTDPPVDDPRTPSWTERESLDVPSEMQGMYLPFNPKYLAVTSHASQLASGYIQRFLRKDEFFWTLQLTGANKPPVPNAGLDQTVPQSALVSLDGRASFDRDGVVATYQWRQVGGPPVTLSGAASAQPTFIAPGGLTSPVVLEFELVISDGALASIPDAVRVIVSTQMPGNGSTRWTRPATRCRAC
jgi:LmbE family N-acetylglucosaminyl deacetylase